MGWVQVAAQSAPDSTLPKGKTDSAGHQFCIGIDVFHPVVNLFASGRSAWELSFDNYMHNEYYGVAELGWGSASVNYSNLKYNTSNTFLRLGFNKSILPRDRRSDWDMMFFGLRCAVANVHRSSATFNIADSVWGNTRDSAVASKPSFPAIWAELDLGMRVAIGRSFFAGWTFRGKFMLNAKSFQDLAPQYIAGYGRGDKNTAFDLNVHISWALRWDRFKKGAPPKPANPPIPQAQ